MSGISTLTPHEDCVIDFATEGTVPCATLEAPLQAIKVEYAGTDNLLKATAEHNERNTTRLLSSVDLDEESGRLCLASSDNIKRPQLRALCRQIRLEDDNHILVAGESRAAMDGLHAVDSIYETDGDQVVAGSECGRDRNMTATTHEQRQETLCQDLSALASSATTIVGRTGLEPVTDGL